MPRSQPQPSLVQELKDFFKDIAIIVIIVLIVRSFLFIPFQINGSSMSESYYDREFILVDKFSYRFGEVERGDVVVFRPHVSQQKEFFIKRVIGLPGDTLKVEKGWVYLKAPGEDDYTQLNEGYLNEDNTGSTFIGTSSSVHVYEIPEGQYFVMGDNRNSSTDSRTCFRSCSYPDATNFITDDDISGKVWIDLGYFDWIRVYPRSGFPGIGFGLGEFKFVHPKLGIDTTPKWLSSPDSWEYE